MHGKIVIVCLRLDILIEFQIKLLILSVCPDTPSKQSDVIFTHFHWYTELSAND